MIIIKGKKFFSDCVCVFILPDDSSDYKFYLSFIASWLAQLKQLKTEWWKSFKRAFVFLWLRGKGGTFSILSIYLRCMITSEDLSIKQHLYKHRCCFIIWRIKVGQVWGKIELLVRWSFEEPSTEVIGNN